MTNIEKSDNELAEFLDYLHKKGEIKPFLEDIYLITLHVAGLFYTENIDLIFPNLKKGDRLELFRENDNHYDRLAILVTHKGKKIGYVPRKDNKILANLMDGGKEIYGVIESVVEEKIYKNDLFREVKFKVYLKE